MNKLFRLLIAFLFYVPGIACMTTNPIPCPQCPVQKPCPTCPPVPPSPPPVVVIKHDSFTTTVTLFKDTTGITNTITLPPIPGDNYYQLQAGIDFCKNKGMTLQLTAGVYSYSHTLMIVDTSGGTFRQVSLRMIGATSCKASPDGVQTRLIPTFNDAPGIIVQLGKGVLIENIACPGKFLFPNTLSPYRIQTLRYADWDDHTTRTNRWSPECFLAVDPFSTSQWVDSSNMYPSLKPYYFVNMSRSGTTGLQVIGCRAINHVVGIIFEPTYQQNGDCSDIIDCDIEYCRSAIAYGQDQTKGNQVIRLKCWGMTHTVIDCNHYGNTPGCMPFIDGMNIAGGVYQLFYCISGGRFTAGAYNIYAEMLFKIGVIGGRPVPGIYNSTIDFMDFGWSPDFIVLGDANFNDCNIRIYNGQSNKIILANFAGSFTGGAMEQPLTTGLWQGGVYSDTPRFSNVRTFNTDGPAGRATFINKASDRALLLDSRNPGTVLSIDSVKYQATIQLTGPGQVAVGDLILSGGQEATPYYDPAEWSLTQATVRIGRVISVSGNLATLDQVGLSVLQMRGKQIYFYKSI